MVSSDRLGWHYNNVDQALSFAVVKCPICNEPYHFKGALRTHLQREHTKIEVENFLKNQK